MQKDDSKFISRVKKVYYSCGFNEKFHDYKEFIKEYNWVKYFRNGGSIYSGSKGKRYDEYCERLKQKREVKRSIESEIEENVI